MWISTSKGLNKGATIKLLCKDICSQSGCTYWVSKNISAEILRDKNCEQGWYSQTYGLLGDPYAPDGIKHSVVADIKPEKMTTYHCLGGIYHLVGCTPSDVKYNHTYHVFESQMSTPKPSPSSGLKVGLGLGFGLVQGLVVIVLVLAFLLLFVGKREKNFGSANHQEMVERQHPAEFDQSAADQNNCNQEMDVGQCAEAHQSPLNQCVMDEDKLNKMHNGGPPTTGHT